MSLSKWTPPPPRGATHGMVIKLRSHVGPVWRCRDRERRGGEDPGDGVARSPRHASFETNIYNIVHHPLVTSTYLCYAFIYSFPGSRSISITMQHEEFTNLKYLLIVWDLISPCTGTVCCRKRKRERGKRRKMLEGGGGG